MSLTIQSEEAITIEPTVQAKSAIIWLHGLGADGHDFVPLVPELGLDQAGIRFIFPHAPFRPITLNGGMSMRGWYDIVALSSSAKEDEEGLRHSQLLIENIIDTQMNKGIPSNKIILAGFSQGGALALQCGLRYAKPLAGILVLSAYLPLASLVEKEAHFSNCSTPILMLHGSEDALVAMNYAYTSYQYLKQHNYPIEWRSYPMAHSVCIEEIADISRWLKLHLASN